jgi:methenyltetrahydrofolate cyclohydrolase
VFRWPGWPTSLSSGNSAWRSSRRRSTPTPCIEALDETDLPRQPLGQFLSELAARLPTPGAGAAAAIEAALSASLIAMIGRFTADDQTADAVSAIVAAADAQRSACLVAAAEDEAAFSAVTEAMKMPRSTPQEQQVRRSNLEQAQRAAAQPPRTVVTSTVALVGLAERLLPIANHKLISDIAAATAAARAAASTARLAVETNLVGLDDKSARAELAAVAAAVEDVARRADRVEAAVREIVHG